MKNLGLLMTAPSDESHLMGGVSTEVSMAHTW